jgi:dihydrodipicolinate synthase/N-acetylneuraminate lyase
MKFVIDGVMPIVPTPFLPNEDIAFEELAGLVDFAVAANACAVCLPAYASEFYKLSGEERLQVVAVAVRAASGRIPVVAQVNSQSTRLAIQDGLKAAELGASAICTAVPRLFATSEDDLFEHFDALLSEISLPFVVQDFHPNGPTITAEFIQRMHSAHNHFCYVKLEQPLMQGTIESIRSATGGHVGVLEGWGGMYTLELAAAGAAGVVPGLALTDLLDRVFTLAKAGKREQAYPIFQGLLPQIVYSLQNMELFHHAEKRLLRARGVLKNTTVRRLERRTTAQEETYLAFLEDQILALLACEGMAADPRVSARPVAQPL